MQLIYSTRILFLNSYKLYSKCRNHIAGTAWQKLIPFLTKKLTIKPRMTRLGEYPVHMLEIAVT